MMRFLPILCASLLTGCVSDGTQVRTKSNDLYVSAFDDFAAAVTSQVRTDGLIASDTLGAVRDRAQATTCTTTFRPYSLLPPSC